MYPNFMKYRLIALILGLLLFSCSKESSEIPNDPDEVQLISSISRDDETGVDSLFYENNRLKAVQEYIEGNEFFEGGIDYITTYEYNSGNQLSQISRIHSKSDIPDRVTRYFYNSDGTLKQRRTLYNSREVITDYTYEEERIRIHVGEDFEVRVNLDENRRIQNVEKKSFLNEGYYAFKTFEYDENGNVTKLSIRQSEESILEEYSFTYDDKENPFVVFDYKLPNGLSIKMLEETERVSNYPFITDGSEDNYLGFFNTNNIISCIGFSNSEYSYTYNEMDLPSKITYDFLQNKSSLILTYY